MIAEDGLAGSTALAVEEPAPAGSPPRRVRPWQWETALVVALSALTFAVHDVAYVLSQPYWTDEAWVAASTKYPMTDLRDVTASTRSVGPLCCASSWSAARNANASNHSCSPR